MLACPLDNTSEWVQLHVTQANLKGLLIHTEIAQEIAAGYATPRSDGLLFREFADTGEVSGDLILAIDKLRDNEEREIQQGMYGELDMDVPSYCLELLAVAELRSYVVSVLRS
jgi:hypothetical protein